MSFIISSSIPAKSFFRPLASTTLTIINCQRLDFISSISRVANKHASDDDNVKFVFKFIPRIAEYNDAPFIKLSASKLTEPVVVQYTVSILGADKQKLYSQMYSWKFNKENESNISKLISSSEINKYMPDDRLRLLIEIDILDSKPNPNQLALNQVTLDYASLLETGKHSDAVLIVEDKEIHVHKNILAARSEMFAAMFENDFIENRSSLVEILDLSFEICQHLLTYIYTGQVPTLNQENALDLLIASDKYQLSHLKSICEQHLCSSSLNIDTVCQTYMFADMHQAAELKAKCFDYIIENVIQVMETEGFKSLASVRLELVLELFKHIALKSIEDMVKC